MTNTKKAGNNFFSIGRWFLSLPGVINNIFLFFLYIEKRVPEQFNAELDYKDT